VVETQLWNALPNFMRTVDDALAKIGAEPLPPQAIPFVIGSWMGGDRDGNPFVTAETTRDVVLLGRWRAADLYYRQVDRLLFELSVSKCSDELAARVAGISVDQLWYGPRRFHDDDGDTTVWPERPRTIHM
jgi:phosphoenolpyruvate carboxylase